MNVGDDTHATLFTEVPEFRIVPPIEADDPGIQTMGVQIVIRNEVQDTADIALATAEEKGAALSPAMMAAPPQFSQESSPEQP